MPIYEYQCTKCRSKFEVVRKVSDPPLKKCERCNGPLRKLFAAPAIQFKGSGFYITDYPKKSAPGPEKESPSKGQRLKTGPAAEAKADSSAPADGCAPKKD